MQYSQSLNNTKRYEDKSLELKSTFSSIFSGKPQLEKLLEKQCRDIDLDSRMNNHSKNKNYAKNKKSISQSKINVIRLFDRPKSMDLLNSELASGNLMKSFNSISFLKPASLNFGVVTKNEVLKQKADKIGFNSFEFEYMIGQGGFGKKEFFIACLILGIEYLHSQNIIHRDIKPENLVFDYKGYLSVTDLGIARELKDDNSHDTSGTPGYMAPEVICRQNHGLTVDFFAVGVITYEIMLSKVSNLLIQRPYAGRNRKEIRDAILAKQVQVKDREKPLTWSDEAVDFINKVISALIKMIQRKPQNRLGFNKGTDEVKSHPWLKNFPWAKLSNRELPSPFLPSVKISSN